METDIFKTDPLPDAGHDGQGDYGFAFNRNTCIQCMACTAGYTDCSEPAAAHYHINAMQPSVTEQICVDPALALGSCDGGACEPGALGFCNRADGQTGVLDGTVVGDIANEAACTANGAYNTWTSSCVDLDVVTYADVDPDVKHVDKSGIPDKIRLTFTASGKQGGAEIYHRPDDIDANGFSLDRWTTDDTRVYYSFTGCPDKDRLGDRDLTGMTLYDPRNKPMVDFDTTVYSFVRVNRLEDSDCTAAKYSFAKAAQPDIYPGTDVGHIIDDLVNLREATFYALPTDIETGQETSPDVYNGAQYRDSAADAYTGIHSMSQTDPIIMSTRTATADVWYRLTIDQSAGIQNGIIPSDDSSATAGVTAVPPNVLSPTFVIDQSDIAYSGGDANYHAIPGSCIDSTTDSSVSGGVDLTSCEIDRQLGMCATADTTDTATGVVTPGTTVPSATNSLSCAANDATNVWAPDNFEVLQTDNECDTSNTDLGLQTSATACASVCAANPDCTYFIYGQGTSTTCKMEATADGCSTDGTLVTSTSFDLYRVKGPIWTPPTNPPGAPVLKMTTVVTAVAVSKDKRACFAQMGNGQAACDGAGACTWTAALADGSTPENCEATLQDSDPTTVAYIVQVEPVVCTNPVDQGTYQDSVSTPLTTPTVFDRGGSISYNVPNTNNDQFYVPNEAPRLYEGANLVAYANKPNLEQSPYTYCPYCLKLSVPYYFSEQFYGYVDWATTTPAVYPLTYPSDRGGASESGREDPVAGTQDKAIAIVIQQKSEIDGFPASQDPTPSTGDVYITQDACCDAALANDNLPLDNTLCLTEDNCAYPDPDLYGLKLHVPGSDVAVEETCSAIDKTGPYAAVCSSVVSDGTAATCEDASGGGRCVYTPICRWYMYHKYHDGDNLDLALAPAPAPVAIPFSMSHKFCTKVVPTLANTCDQGTDGTGGTFESDILATVYHVRANPVTFNPPNHAKSQFSAGTCIELSTYNPLYADSGSLRGHEDMYYIVGRPDQRFDLLGTSPGVYSRDSSLPTVCAAATLDGTEATCLAAGACTYTAATASNPEVCVDRPWSTAVNPQLSRYTGCIPLTQSSSIAAVAIGDGFAPSTFTVATYWLQIDQPTITVFASGGATDAADQLAAADTLAADPVGLTNTFYSYIDIAIDPIVQSTNTAQPVPDLVPEVYLAVAHQDPESACPACFSCDIGCPAAVRTSMANMVNNLQNMCEYKETDYCSGCTTGDRLVVDEGFDCDAFTSSTTCVAAGGNWATFPARGAFWVDTCADPTSGNNDATDNFGYTAYRQTCVNKMADMVDWLEGGFISAAGAQADSCLRYFDLNFPTIKSYVETCAAYKPSILNVGSATAAWRLQRGRENSCSWLRYDPANKPRIDASSTLYVFSQKKDSSGSDLLLPSEVLRINYDIKVDEVKMLPCGVPTATSQLYQGPQDVQLSTMTTSYANSITGGTSGNVEFRYFYDDTFYDTSTSSALKRDENGNMMRQILRSFPNSADPESKTGDKLNPYVQDAYDRCYDVPGLGDGSMDRNAVQSCVATDPADTTACAAAELGQFMAARPGFAVTCTGTPTAGGICTLDTATTDINVACAAGCTATFYDPTQPQKNCEAAGACLYSQPRIPCQSDSTNPNGQANPTPSEFISRRDNRGTFFGASRGMTSAELTAAAVTSGQAFSGFRACADDTSYACTGCLVGDCTTITDPEGCASAAGTWDCDHCGSCAGGTCGTLKTQLTCEADGGTWYYPYTIQNSGKLYVYASKVGSIDSEVSTCESVIQVRPPTWFQSGQMCIDIAGDGATKCEVPAFLGSGFVVLTPAAGDDSDQTHIYYKYKANMEADPLSPAVCFDPTDGEFCSPIDALDDENCAATASRDACLAKPKCQYNSGGFDCDACDISLATGLTAFDGTAVATCSQVKSVDDCDTVSGRWVPKAKQATGLDTCVTRSVDVCQRSLGHCESCGSGARREAGSGYDCDAVLTKAECLVDLCMRGSKPGTPTDAASCETTGECTNCVKDGVTATQCVSGPADRTACEGAQFLGTWSAAWIVCTGCNAAGVTCSSLTNKEDCELQGDGIWMGPEWVTIEDSIGYGTCEAVTVSLATCLPMVTAADCLGDVTLGCTATANALCVADATAGTCPPPAADCSPFKLITGVDGDPADCPTVCTYTASVAIADTAVLTARASQCAGVVNDRNEATCTTEGSASEARSTEVGDRTPNGFVLNGASGEYWGDNCKYTPDSAGDGSLAAESQKVCEVDLTGDQSGLDAKVLDRYAGDHCEDCKSQNRMLAGYGFDCDAIKTKARCQHDGGTWVSVEAGVCTYNANGGATCTGTSTSGDACDLDATTDGTADCLSGCRYNSATNMQCLPMPATSAAQWASNTAVCGAIDALAAFDEQTCINSCVFNGGATATSNCPTGCTYTPEVVGTAAATCTGTLAAQCLFMPAASCSPTDLGACAIQDDGLTAHDENSCRSVGAGIPGIGDCLWAGNGGIANQAVCEGTYTGLEAQGRWTGGMDIAMVRQQAADSGDGNQLAVQQGFPGTKFEQWIQFNAGENIYFSMKARATKPWQVASQELVQTFVIAKLLSQRATVDVTPATALDATCTGCKLENVLVSSSGMFWNSIANIDNVAITLNLPSVFLSDICKMAYCASTSTICSSAGVTCGGTSGTELQATCKISERPVWAPATTQAEYCGIDSCAGYTPGTAGSCPSGCMLAGTAGVDEICTATITDCTTGYTPGTGTCPSGCGFTAAVTTAATCTAVNGAALAGVASEIDCQYPTQSNCGIAGGTWRSGDGGIDQMTCTGSNSDWTPSDECAGNVDVFHTDVRENADGNPTPAAQASCQLYQLLFWNIRYPFVPQQSKPWKRAGSACTNYRMRAYGRVRTQCVDGDAATGTPIALSSSSWLGDVTESCRDLATAPTWTAATAAVSEACADDGSGLGDCTLAPGVDCSDQTVVGAHQAAAATCTGTATAPACALSGGTDSASCPAGCGYTAAVASTCALSGGTGAASCPGGCTYAADTPVAASCTGTATTPLCTVGACDTACTSTAVVVGVATTCIGTQVSDSIDCAANAAWTGGPGVTADCAVADGCAFTAEVTAAAATCTGTLATPVCDLDPATDSSGACPAGCADVAASTSPATCTGTATTTAATCTGTASVPTCTSFVAADADGTSCTAAGCGYVAAVAAGSCTYSAPTVFAARQCVAADGSAVVDAALAAPGTQVACETPNGRETCSSAGGSWKPCRAADSYMDAADATQCLGDGAVYDDACTSQSGGMCSVTTARDACKAVPMYTWIGEDCVGGDACTAVGLLTPESIAMDGRTDQAICVAVMATDGTPCTYVAGDEPKYTDAQFYAPQFSAGAGVFDEDADAFRPDDLWTPKNPVTVTSLQYECLVPPMFMDYWSVFGIPRAPRNSPANLDATKCDDGENTDGTQRPAKCGARALPGSTICPAGQAINRYGGCSYTSKLGDGVCDREFNHAIFLYDELDCFYSAMEEISGATMSFSGGS